MKITGIICCLALLCTACSEEKTELPWGSDNYIVSFSLTTGADTYPAVIRARTEGILLDPVYTGKAFAGMMQLLRRGAFDGQDDLLFVHTGGTAALFAIDLPR